ncbi:MAG: type II toxin-antitoxin system PemK/MazF family toxin [Anaerolinea sp.]|nr:type II toxin-antitoxin system PemK/MazF family toxin [Anaerolinea sp.]
MTLCKRGEVYFADLNPVRGREQGGRRPVLIIQNDIGNRHSPVTIVAAITSAVSERAYPTEVRLAAGLGGLPRESAVLLNQIKTIDKERLDQRLGQLDAAAMRQVDEAIKLSLGLTLL